MTDDQDYVLGSTNAAWMPSLDKYLRRRGLELPNFITSMSSCCPSRVSFFTGKYCHTTNITSNGPDRGAVGKFYEYGLGEDYLPLWLQSAGYSTFLVGKFLNGFTYGFVRNHGCPRGWTVIDPIIQQQGLGSSELYPRYPLYMRNCVGQTQAYVGQFHEEVIRQKALSSIDDAVSRDKPFFLYVSTVAPHDAAGIGAYPQVPPAYRDLFPGVQAPRTANWGRPVPIPIGFTSQRYADFNTTDIDGRYRARLQSLRAVDDTIAALVERLECHGVLNNTVIIFTSDNGFKLGNHNMPQEKFTFYEEDVRVPLLMAGPAVPRGVYAAGLQASMTDLTATVVALAGAGTGNISLDGVALPLQNISRAYPQPYQPGASTSQSPGSSVLCPGLPPFAPMPPELPSPMLPPLHRPPIKVRRWPPPEQPPSQPLPPDPPAPSIPDLPPLQGSLFRSPPPPPPVANRRRPPPPPMSPAEGHNTSSPENAPPYPPSSPFPPDTLAPPTLPPAVENLPPGLAPSPPSQPPPRALRRPPPPPPLPTRAPQGPDAPVQYSDESPLTPSASPPAPPNVPLPPPPSPYSTRRRSPPFPPYVFAPAPPADQPPPPLPSPPPQLPPPPEVPEMPLPPTQPLPPGFRRRRPSLPSLPPALPAPPPSSPQAEPPLLPAPPTFPSPPTPHEHPTQPPALLPSLPPPQPAPEHPTAPRTPRRGSSPPEPPSRMPPRFPRPGPHARSRPPTSLPPHKLSTFPPPPLMADAANRGITPTATDVTPPSPSLAPPPLRLPPPLLPMPPDPGPISVPYRELRQILQATSWWPQSQHHSSAHSEPLFELGQGAGGRGSPSQRRSRARRALAASGGSGGAVTTVREWVAKALLQSLGGGGSSSSSSSSRKGMGTEAQSSRRVAAEDGGPVGNASAPLPFYGNWSNAQLIEAWLDGQITNFAGRNYRALRICSTFAAYGPPTVFRSDGHTCYKYLLFCNPRFFNIYGTYRQLFDLGRDPVELVNRYTEPLFGVTKRLVDRLDAVLTVMSYCSGVTCRNPFLVIHPDGSISNLFQAMDPRFDDLYDGFQKMAFKRCAIYYHPENDLADLRLVPRDLWQYVGPSE